MGSYLILVITRLTASGILSNLGLGAAMGGRQGIAPTALVLDAWGGCFWRCVDILATAQSLVGHEPDDADDMCV